MFSPRLPDKHGPARVLVASELQRAENPRSARFRQEPRPRRGSCRFGGARRRPGTTGGAARTRAQTGAKDRRHLQWPCDETDGRTLCCTQRGKARAGPRPRVWWCAGRSGALQGCAHRMPPRSTAGGPLTGPAPVLRVGLARRWLRGACTADKAANAACTCAAATARHPRGAQTADSWFPRLQQVLTPGTTSRWSANAELNIVRTFPQSQRGPHPPGPCKAAVYEAQRSRVTAYHPPWTKFS